MDLVFVIRDPFTKMESRSKWYIIISSTIALIPNEIRDFAKNVNTDRTDADLLVVIVAYPCMVVLAIISCLYAWINLRKPGVSAELRGMVVKRHISFMFVSVLVNYYLFEANLVAFMGLTREEITS